MQYLLFSYLDHSLQKPQRRLRVETDQQFLRSSETGPSDTNRPPLPFLPHPAAQLELQQVVLATSTR